MSAKRKTGENGRDPARGPAYQGPDRRAGDRRKGTERRRKDVPVAKERRSGKERRAAGSGNRRKVVRRINEYVLEADVLEFINAVNEYKSVHQRPFPTWSEIYRIFVDLGYRKGD